MKIKVNDIIEAEVIKLSFGFEAIARHQNMVIFINGAVPGDILKVRITEVKKRFLRADIAEIIKPSLKRRKPPCRYFDNCGGCHLQNIKEDAQLEFKYVVFQDVLRQINKMQKTQILPVLKTDFVNYRNKVQWVNSSSGMGLYAINSHNVIDIDNCLIQKEINNKLLNVVRRFAAEKGWQPFDPLNKTGSLRYVVSRSDHREREVLLTLVSASKELPYLDEFTRVLQDKIPEIKGVNISVNTSSSNIVMSNKTDNLWGRDFINEKISDIKYKISSDSFFQVNIKGFEKILKIIKNEAGSVKTIVDAYCGTGAISLQLSSNADIIYGFEENSKAINDAKENAKNNNIKNIKFFNLKVSNGLDFIHKSRIKTGLLILDPPRAGCEKEVVEKIKIMKPNKIIYVSCNPSTLARDLQELIQFGYKIKYIQPVDMFPQTYHIESVTVVSSS